MRPAAHLMAAEWSGPWRLLLAAYLMAWVPLNFAAAVASVLPSLGMRGAPAAIELALHGIVAALAFAAGRAIVSRREDAEAFASVAVALSTAAGLQSLHWSSLPGQTKPGDEWPLSLVLAVHGAAWLWYLRRRVRASR